MDKKSALKQQLSAFKKKAGVAFPIQRMILIGSKAWGKPHKYSDVDLIIVSSKFKKLDFFQRGARMYDYWSINSPVDFLCYTPEEFHQLSGQVTLVSKALKEGIFIK